MNQPHRKKLEKLHVSWTSRGFTLLELMVVVVIIGVLTSLALPSFRLHILKGHLETAKPYLMAIAARERSYYNRYGSYYTSANQDEQDLADNLGVELDEAADFCFVVRVGNNNFISTSGNGSRFEVWAVLRQDGGGNDPVNVSDGAGVTCLTANNKQEATGWVGPASSGVGGEGRVVVLRYPAPRFTQGEDTAVRAGRTNVFLIWGVDGISVTDPLL